MNREDGIGKELSDLEISAQQPLDPRCVPIKLSENVPEGNSIEYPCYSEEEHNIWKYLFDRQMKFLPGRACSEYLEGTNILNFTPERIPSLKDISRILYDTTGWVIGRVPGLIHEENFFGMLSRRVFPSTDYIRGNEELDYTPAPDLFHDIFGHMPLLTNKNFADFYYLMGKAAGNASGADRRYLETFHWFTVEFGLIKTLEGMRIYGAGIISSLGEVQHALSDHVTVIDFNPDSLVTQPYDVWHIQPLLFAIDSFEQLEDGFKYWIKKRKLI